MNAELQGRSDGENLEFIHGLVYTMDCFLTDFVFCVSCFLTDAILLLLLIKAI